MSHNQTARGFKRLLKKEPLLICVCIQLNTDNGNRLRNHRDICRPVSTFMQHWQTRPIFVSYFVNMSSSKCLFPIRRVGSLDEGRSSCRKHTSQTLHNDGHLNRHSISNGAAQCLCVCTYFSCCYVLLCFCLQ